MVSLYTHARTNSVSTAKARQTKAALPGCPALLSAVKISLITVDTRESLHAYAAFTSLEYQEMDEIPLVSALSLHTAKAWLIHHIVYQ